MMMGRELVESKTGAEVLRGLKRRCFVHSADLDPRVH